MLHYVVINTNPKRLERMQAIVPRFEVFKGTTGPDPKKAYTEYIPKTYQRLADHALKKKWDRKTIVLQDDVWIPQGEGLEAMLDEYPSELLVLGRTDSTGLICPLAFAANSMIWQKLAVAWDGKRRICTAWRPIVDRHGLVLDIVKPMSGPPSVALGTGRNAPCVNCP